MSVDVTTLAVIRGALETIALEMDSTLPLAAFSSAIAEGRDYADGIYSKTGEVIVQGRESLPVFVGAMQFCLQKSLKEIDVNDLSPGDIFIVNDVYVGGTHLQDVKFFQPYFCGDELCAFLANCGHWLDIGGCSPGGKNPYAEEIFQEGLRIPPVKIYNKGKLNKDMLSIIMRNIRSPRESYGDLMAQIKALHVGESRLNELFGRYSRDVVMEAFDELEVRAERQMRSYISEIPDGVYTFTDYMDNNGVENKPLVINLKLEVKRDGIHFDFSGTSESTPTFANVVETATRTSCFVAMRHIFPDVPINSGVFKPFTFNIPEGCFLNAPSPRATVMNPEINSRTVDVVFGALAQVIPDKVYAASYGTSNILTIAGDDPLRGKYIVASFWGGGLGGHAKGDGLTHGVHPPTSAKTQPVEVYEQRFPLLFKRFAIREGSAGAGKYRGGFGSIYEIEIVRGEAKMTNVADRGIIAPYGINGGKEAKKNEIVYYLGGKEFIPPMITKADKVRVEKGDRLVIRSPGGGGYGNPLERDVDLVLKDVKMQYITSDDAEKDYGVVIVDKDGKLEIDRERTAQLRQRRGEQT